MDYITTEYKQQLYVQQEHSICAKSSAFVCGYDKIISKYSMVANINKELK